MLFRSATAAIALLFPFGASADINPVDCVAVYDSLENRVGRLIPRLYNNSDSNIAFDIDGTTVLMEFDQSGIYPFAGSLWYEAPGCVGSPLMIPRSVGVIIEGQGFYSADFGSTVFIASQLGQNGNCGIVNSTLQAASAIEFEVPDFTPPFRVRSEACSSQIVPSFAPTTSLFVIFPLLAVGVLMAFGAASLRGSRRCD